MLTILFIQTLHRREIFYDLFVITHYHLFRLATEYGYYSQSFVIIRYSIHFVVNLLSFQNFVVLREFVSPSQKISNLAAKFSNDSCFFFSVASA